MSIKIYNTLTRKKEELETTQPGQVTMYVCGPTVYNKAHVGHAMSAMVFDIVRRYLEYRGYNVKHAMNYTDVDDKIIQRANLLEQDPFELAQKYIDEYEQNLTDLNIKHPSITPKATQEIDQIIGMVQKLIDKGYAYASDGDVYFRVTKFDGYGKLSGRKLDDMQAGARIDIDDRKEHPMDFALWKSARPDEPYWETPWGIGRPGWHIECSAMNLGHLGEQIDIHGGGNDLIFPHHENEIAQTESLTEKTFARYWMHNGMLQFSGEKMSKSLGNLVTIEEFIEEHSADALRFMVINSGYRNPLTFNDEVITQAERALERLQSALRPQMPDAKGAPQAELEELSKQIEATKTGFINAMDDDFNSGGAMGYLFELVRVINHARDNNAADSELKPAQDLLSELLSVFGFILNTENAKDHTADPFIDLLVELRTELRGQKLYALSDQIRDQLIELGVLVEDAKGGSTWRWA